MRDGRGSTEYYCVAICSTTPKTVILHRSHNSHDRMTTCDCQAFSWTKVGKEPTEVARAAFRWLEKAPRSLPSARVCPLVPTLRICACGPRGTFSYSVTLFASTCSFASAAGLNLESWAHTSPSHSRPTLSMLLFLAPIREDEDVNYSSFP